MAVLFVPVARYCVYNIYSITLLPDFFICCDFCITKYPYTMLKGIRRSSVLLRSAVAPDVSKDRGTLVSIGKPRYLTVICTAVPGAEHIRC